MKQATPPTHGRNRRARPPRGDERQHEVQSVSRALSILEALAEGDDGLTLTILAHAVRLPASTTHRLLTTLQKKRFVRFDPASMAWQIGVQAFTVGNAFTRNRDVVTMARPQMRQLMELSGETVNLYFLVDGEVMLMAQIESRQTMRAIARPGGRTTMHSSAAGKAILAHLPNADAEKIIADQGLPRSTANTLVTKKALRGDLRRTRECGYAVDDEEHAVGLRCAAAPILDEHGFPFAGLSLSGPTARVTDDRLETLGRLVAEAARATAAELGGRAAAPIFHDTE